MATPVPVTPATTKAAAAPATTGAAALANAAGATPGFTIVRVRRPDGTIVRVKRPNTAMAANGGAGAQSTLLNLAPAVTHPAPPSPPQQNPQTKQPQATVEGADPLTQGVNPTPAPTGPTATAPTSVIGEKLSQKVATPSTSPTSVPTTSNQTPQVGASAKEQGEVRQPGTTSPDAKPASKPDMTAATQQMGTKPTKEEAVLSGPSSSPPPNAIPGAGFQVLSRFGGMARRGLLTTLSAIHPDLNMGDDFDDMFDFVGDMESDDEECDDGDDGDDHDDDMDSDSDEYDRREEVKSGGEVSQTNGAQGNAPVQKSSQGPNNTRSYQNDTREVVNAVAGNVARTVPFWSFARPPAPATAAAAKPNEPTTSTTTPKTAAATLTPAAVAPNGVTDPVMSEKTSTAAADPIRSKPAVQISEKQLDSNSDLPPAKPQSKPPRKLNRRSSIIALIIVWSITVCLPILFIVLGILAILLRNERADSLNGFQVTQAIKVAVTAWPIVFAAIVAQTLKAFATYRVERGIRLMTLEQLISSNSFASAMKQPLLLRKLDLTTIALFVLWTLSPLASQALQRVSYTTTGSATNITKLFFVDNTVLNPHFSAGASQLDTTLSINSLYTAAILPRGAQEPVNMDPWRYPLIPALHLLEANPENKEPNSSWYSAKNMNIQNYTSPIGIPYMPLPYGNFTNGTYSVILPSTYYRFQCQNIKTISSSDLLQMIHATNDRTGRSGSGTGWIDMNPPQQRDQAGNFSFASLIGGQIGSNVSENSSYAYSTCALTQIYVDSDIYCDDRTNATDCVVRRIRKSTNAKSEFHPLTKFHSHFVDAGTAYSNDISGTPTLWERYLMDPQKLLYDRITVDLTKMILNADPNATATLERRLGRLFNTYWQAGFDPMYQTGFYPNKDDFQHDVNFSDGKTFNEVKVWPLEAIFTNTTPVYDYSIPWLVILFICAVFLLAAGIASAIWESLTIAPDILGFASSIVRSSKYLDLPKMGSTMSGPERARALANIRVMMQDVRPQADVGRIALKPWAAEATGLMPGRYYR